MIIKGALTSGSSIDGSTVTGGTVQTSSAANTGIKMNSSGLTAYGGGQPVFTLSASTGEVQMKGSITSGSTINGAQITGGRIVIPGQNGYEWRFGSLTGFLPVALTSVRKIREMPDAVEEPTPAQAELEGGLIEGVPLPGPAAADA